MMIKYKFYFAVGSQDLYGDDVLREVASNSVIICNALNKSNGTPWEIIFKGVQTCSDEIVALIKDANSDPTCAGIITWMHTFSPSKMWIRGLSQLNKPYLHLNTQMRSTIPFDSIDMNYMNTNQSAHGDREHGFITARMNIKRDVIAGHWEDSEFQGRVGHWMRSAVGASFSRTLKVMRFGDNMREVAVTEGDKVEAERVLGWSINTWAVGDMVKAVNDVTDAELAAKMVEYKEKYEIVSDNIEAIEYQARMEVAMENLFDKEGINAYTNTFQDLYGLKQLPGLASQNLMSKGYGYGGEGDWKTSALMSITYAMSEGTPQACSFIEDYTYHMEKGNEFVLGAHMLEVSPSITKEKARIDVFPLGIGNREDPARLLFEAKPGSALLVTIVDMGNRFRLIAHDVECVSVGNKMPKLPVAYAAWKPEPDFITGNEAWILAGGTHHSVLTYDLDAKHFENLANMLDVEFIYISKDTTIRGLKTELAVSNHLWNSK